MKEGETVDEYFARTLAIPSKIKAVMLSVQSKNPIL